jgi:predicted enzyme related to lactoylglutathione lyase
MRPATASSLADAPATTVLRAEDVDRAAHFYTEKLGLAVEYLSSQEEFWAYAGKGTLINVYARPGMPAPQNTACAFSVPDVEATVRELRDRGVVFEDYDIPEMGLKTVDGIAEFDGSKVAWFKDSEDNILMIAPA